LGFYSSWADDIRNSPEWRFTSSFHYANIPDNDCNYIHSRDCINPCIVSSILNYTNQMNDLNDETSKIALKFVIHFLGFMILNFKVTFINHYILEELEI
jgi:hypothetical protein